MVFRTYNTISKLHNLSLRRFIIKLIYFFLDRDTYDYIVVGGGSAGVIVAARLVEANFKTLIVEAGGNSGLESMVIT